MRKIPTLFVRDFERDNGRYVTREVNPGCEWVLDGEGIATRKIDGTCVLIRDDGTVAARREVKPGKTPPPGFEQVEADETTGKAVGWEPADQSSFAKLLAGIDTSSLAPGTYELIGPKVNGNPEGYAEHALVPHGSIPVEVPDRSYDSIAEWAAAHPTVEGIVFWRKQGDPDAGMVKIKRRDFRTDRRSLDRC